MRFLDSLLGKGKTPPPALAQRGSTRTRRTDNTEFARPARDVDTQAFVQSAGLDNELLATTAAVTFGATAMQDEEPELLTGTQGGRVVSLHAQRVRAGAAGTSAAPGSEAAGQAVAIAPVAVPATHTAPANPARGMTVKPKSVASYAAIVDSLGKPWRGTLTGVVAPEYANRCVVLDITCGQVVLVVTAEVIDSAHYKAVLSKIAKEWLFAVTQVLVASEIVVAEVQAKCMQMVALSSDDALTNFEGRFVRFYDDIVEGAVDAKASDIHFTTEAEDGVVGLRVYGRLRPWLRPHPQLILDSIGAAFGARYTAETATKEQYSTNVPVAFMTKQKVNRRDWSGRYNGRPHATGYKGVMRLLEGSVRVEGVPTIAQLGYSPSQVTMLQEALRRQWGLIVIAGSTGSGKSTTLRTFMVRLPNGESEVRYACESPVEYDMPGVTQFSIPMDVNMSREAITAKFVSVLRDLMRMDPDVLMMGEVRDKETARLAAEFTSTGHRCFTTVHGEGAVDSVARMAGGEIALPADELGGGKFLNAVIYQKLLPQLCKLCRIPATDAKHGLTRAKRNVLAQKYQLDAGSMYVANPTGCASCKPAVHGLAANGTTGVTVAAEILIPTASMRRHIRDKDWPALTLAWRSKRTAGFADENTQGKTAFEHALWLAAQGRVSLSDIEAVFEPIESYEIVPIALAEGAPA